MMGEEIQQQPQERERRESVSASLPMFMNPDLGKWMLDSNDEWENLELILAGWKINSKDPYTEDGKINWEQGEALMNEKGRKILINTMIRGISHKGVFLTNMNENEVYKIARKVLNDIAKQIATFNEEFGIKSMAEQQMIMDLLLTNVMAILKRPFNQGERDFFKKITTEKRVVGGEEKKGFGVMGGKR